MPPCGGGDRGSNPRRGTHLCQNNFIKISIMGKNVKNYTLFFDDGRKVEVKKSSASLFYVVAMNEQRYNKKVEKVYVDQYVPYIRDGTVIDHIPEGKGVKIYDYLSKVVPKDEDKVILLAGHLPSNKLGRKDLIKVCNHKISEEDIEEIFSMFGENEPKPTINYIEYWDVSQKINSEEFLKSRDKL